MCTYLSGSYWPLTEGESLAEALHATPERVSLPPTLQGEAICFAADNHHLYVTSEGEHPPLEAVAVP